MTIGLLGMAFKAESDDSRASLSYKFKKALAAAARGVLTTDPFVTTDPELLPFDEVIARSDLLILIQRAILQRTAGSSLMARTSPINSGKQSAM